MTVPYPTPHRSWLRLNQQSYSTANTMTSPSAVIYGVTGQGTGYHNGDIVTLPATASLAAAPVAATGYSITPASFRLTVVGGNVTAATVTRGGEYPNLSGSGRYLPTNPVSTTGGSGTGLKLTVNWGSNIGSAEVCATNILNDSGNYVAQNADMISNPHELLVPIYAAQTDAKQLLYVDFTDQTLDDGTGTNVATAPNYAMTQWCIKNGIDPETMYLHFFTPTTADLLDGKGAFPLPGFGGQYSDGTPAPLGSRVPVGYGWSPKSNYPPSPGYPGLPYKPGTCVMMNIANPNYQTWAVQYFFGKVQAIGGHGFWMDEMSYGAANASGYVLIPGGGTYVPSGPQVYTEYPSASGLKSSAVAWTNDFPACVKVSATLLHAANCTILINVGNYGHNWAEMFGVVDYMYRESEIGTGRCTDSYLNAIQVVVGDAHAHGMVNVLALKYTCDNNGTSYTAAMCYLGYQWRNNQLQGLAVYYLVANPTDYMCVDSGAASDPLAFSYFGAMDYDIGAPQSPPSGATLFGSDGAYVFAKGIDVSSPIQFSGTGTWKAGPGSGQYTLTDPTANWPAPNGLVNLNVFYGNGLVGGIGANTATTLVCYHPPGPPSGSMAYSIGNWVFTIYARQYENALVLLKTIPAAKNNKGVVPGITVVSAAIVNPGSGYTNKDIVTVQGGSYAYGSQALMQLKVVGGIVTEAVPYLGNGGGNYLSDPSSINPASVTGGTGNGLTVNLKASGKSSATRHNLPPSPTGNWFFLEADGTVEPSNLSSILLSDNAAAILVTRTTVPVPKPTRITVSAVGPNGSSVTLPDITVSPSAAGSVKAIGGGVFDVTPAKVGTLNVSSITFGVS